MKGYSPYQFAFFRILLGVYLTIHFVQLIPYAPEIWSHAGLLPDASLNLTYGVFPNLLNVISSPIQVQIFVGLLVLLALLFMIGFQRPFVAILLWYGWVCLFDRNNLISNPGIPYVGWILLACAVIPKGEPLSVTKTKTEEKWVFPMLLFVGAWAIMSIGYTISGIDKFYSPSWRDGSAIFHLLENPLARDWWLRELFLSFPDFIIKLMTWSTLTLEILFLPLALLTLTRKWVWLAMIFMHLGILAIVDFADLTLGMLMIHWFTFDGSWLKSKEKHTGIVFSDGVCNLCNSFVDFLLGEDRNTSLRFASLQGETAKEKLPAPDLEKIETIIYYSDNQVYKQSDAVIQIMNSLGGVWKIGIVFKIIPKFIRDGLYSYVAKNRYKWFGEKDTCRMPTQEERERFLP